MVYAIIGSRLGNQNDDELNKVFRHVCKDNYLTQALVVMRLDEKESGFTAKGVHAVIAKILSVTILVIFVIFIGFFQYLTILYLTNTFWLLAVLAALLYLSYYYMFFTGLIVDGENETDSDGALTRKQNFSKKFGAGFAMLMIFNISMAIVGGYEGYWLKTQTIVSSHIDLTEITPPYSMLFSSLIEKNRGGPTISTS